MTRKFVKHSIFKKKTESGSTSFTILLMLSHVQLFATSWAVASQVPLSMGFSRQEYWSGLPFHSPGNLPEPGIEPASPALAGWFFFFFFFFTTEPPGNHLDLYCYGISLFNFILTQSEENATMFSPYLSTHTQFWSYMDHSNIWYKSKKLTLVECTYKCTYIYLTTNNQLKQEYPKFQS